MHLALKKLSLHIDFIAVDGNRFHTFESVRHKCVVKGDGKYQNIAAASILQNLQDDYMKKIHGEFPIIHGIKTKDTQLNHIEWPSQITALPHITVNLFQLLPKQLGPTF